MIKQRDHNFPGKISAASLAGYTHVPTIMRPRSTKDQLGCLHFPAGLVPSGVLEAEVLSEVAENREVFRVLLGLMHSRPQRKSWYETE